MNPNVVIMQAMIVGINLGAILVMGPDRPWPLGNWIMAGIGVALFVCYWVDCRRKP
jgi:hypothetical protein